MSIFDRLFKSGKNEAITLKRSDTNYHYVCQCRLNAFDGITPSNLKFVDTDKYQKVIDLGNICIDEYGIADFAGNFQGDQYFVQLWTAHIIFDHEQASEELKAQCLEIITEYSNHPVLPVVALEEQNWLKNNL